MNIQETLKQSLTGRYQIQEDELDCSLGDTIEKESELVISMGGQTMSIPRIDSAEEAVVTIRNYLCKLPPTGQVPTFTIFQRSFFKIDSLLDEKSNYAIIIFSDKATNFEEAQYLRWDEDSSSWVGANRKLQVFESIRIRHGRDNIGSIKISVGSDFLKNPRVVYGDNQIEIPRTMRTKDTIQNVTIISEEPYRVEIEVQNIGMQYVAKRTRELKMSWKRFVFSKNDNKPIRKSEVELEIPETWGRNFRGELDFEINPLNSEVHEVIRDSEPKYAGAKFYLTHSGQCWVKSQNSWIPIHADYLKHYIDIEDIKDEVHLYEMIQSLTEGEEETTIAL